MAEKLLSGKTCQSRFSLVRRLSRSGRWRHGAALNTDARTIRVPRYMCLASRQLLISRLDSGRSMHSLYYVRDQRFTTLLVAQSALCTVCSCAARVHGSSISNRRDSCSIYEDYRPECPYENDRGRLTHALLSKVTNQLGRRPGGLRRGPYMYGKP